MNLIVLTILFPLLGFILLAVSQGDWSERTVTIIGVGSIGLSMVTTIYVAFDFYCHFYYGSINNLECVFIQELWRWFYIDTLYIFMTLKLDGLSLVMLSVITGVGFLIHIYAVWYMSGQEGYSRFFAYTNLFIANMVLLVLSDNLLWMYFGWEIVGLCSYLLIGFYYLDGKNGAAALKAFITTRIGDICLICAVFMIYEYYRTLSINELIQLKLHMFSSCVNHEHVVWIALMLLIGAIGKSAQFPLHTWLTSAMVGPTPISALIHSATMVTAGVYLIVRMSSFFLMVPNILYLVGVIGSITLIISSFFALFQDDIKKILAYSTISQIGYMFIALGAGSWAAAIFHLTTHAVFKALLFLASGALIYACRHEQNIFKMGGLNRFLPFIYVCFLIGGASLSALPIVTSGFYSKEMILISTLVSHNYFFLCAGLIGTFLTPVYIFRMIFVIFHGEIKIIPVLRNKWCRNFSLIILLLLSTFIGCWIKLPILSVMHDNSNVIYEHYTMLCGIVSGVLVIFGIWVASEFWLYSVIKKDYKIFILLQSTVLTIMKERIVLLCYHGGGFDWLHRIILIQPYLYIVNKLSYCDPINIVIGFFISLMKRLKDVLVFSVNGKLSWYITSINIGAIIVLISVLLCM